MNTHTDLAAASNALEHLVRALCQAERYPHAVTAVELIETHISFILLTGRYAYKLKKPLDLGFLDFSTLEKRQFCCDEELRINQRLAPQLYLDVVPIGGTPDKPLLNTEPAIEYAVRMQQFPQTSLYDRLLSRQALTATHIDRAAAVLARFHQTAERATPAQAFGEAEQVMHPVLENFVQLRGGLATHETDLRQTLDRIDAWSRHEYSRLTTLLGERKLQGFVRECHGDAHLGNMVWLDEDCVFFDGIEFNPALRWIDVISEAAFLNMDLTSRGHGELAARFLNAYLSETGDYAGCALLPFYLCYRAMVRAKVAAIRRNQSEKDSHAHAEAQQDLETYLALAQHYSEPRQPRLIITLGVSGSGKTWATQPLLEKLGAIRLRSDVERKRLFGLTADAKGEVDVGQGIYSKEAGERTYLHLLGQAKTLLQAGFTTIVDATFLKREQRQPFEQLAQDLCLPFTLLHFQAPEDVLRQRVQSRLDEGRDASEANLAVLEAQLKAFEALTKEAEAYLVEVDGSGKIDTHQLVARIQEKAV